MKYEMKLKTMNEIVIIQDVLRKMRDKWKLCKRMNKRVDEDEWKNRKRMNESIV